jgi:O-acetyl-ADP-ribose deacetylase (regulator of RNase III)
MGMTKIIYKKGNLLACEEMFILHGCNAQGVMGAGVALAIRKRYPSAYEAYREIFAQYGLHTGGLITSIQPDNKIVFNGITQKWFGRDGKNYVSYDAVREVVKSVDHIMRDYAIAEGELPRVAMPKIGAGLAGGCWLTIQDILEEFSTKFQPIVYVMEGC